MNLLNSTSDNTEYETLINILSEIVLNLTKNQAEKQDIKGGCTNEKRQ